MDRFPLQVFRHLNPTICEPLTIGSWLLEGRVALTVFLLIGSIMSAINLSSKIRYFMMQQKKCPPIPDTGNLCFFTDDLTFYFLDLALAKLLYSNVILQYCIILGKGSNIEMCDVSKLPACLQ